MKIAINCAFFQTQGGGIKEYIHNLVENLSILDSKNEYVLYVLEDYEEYARENLKTGFRIKTIPFKGDGLVNKIIRSIFERFFWTKEEGLENWDIFHSPFFHSYIPHKARLILTVHDMRFFRYPKTYTFFRYQFLKRAVKRSIAKADRIITISNFTKDEIHEAYKTDLNKIQVIHEAINPKHFKSIELESNDEKLINILKSNPFILSVGHIEPRKNYDRLIEAFKKTKRDLPKGIKLVIVGKLGHNYDQTLKNIESDSDILFLNFVSQGLLNWLYAHTSLFVFPSFYEGFGFPPLEAGMHGAVSAVANISSMPEVCGNAVLYFDPYDINDIGCAIRKGLTNEDLRTDLRKKIKDQLSKFSWKENAKKTIEVYKSI
ncbi:MAG: glycosyltransferase family 4 protein [Muribaculaceae bacterium]|nr:glycosyltransferase family 4 protein [Muribaculaceae bacterium]